MTQNARPKERDKEILYITKNVYRSFKDGVMVFPGVYLNMSAAFFWEASTKFEKVSRSDLRFSLVGKIKNKFIALPPDDVVEKDVDCFIDDCINSGLIKTSAYQIMPDTKTLSVDTKYIPKVEMVLTHNCNFRCRHCFIEAKKKLDNELSFHQWEVVLRKLLNMGLINLTLSGGEPGYWGHLPAFLQLLDSSPEIFIDILTNASLMGAVELIEFLEKFKGRTKMQISLNSITEDGYQKFTGQKIYPLKDTLKNIRMLGAAGIKPIIITQANVENIEFILNGDFMGVLHDLGIEKWVVQPNWRSIGRALLSENTMRADVEQAYSFVRELETNMVRFQSVEDIDIIMDALPSLTYGTVFYSDEYSYSACKGYSNSVAVNADGEIYLCSEFISFGKNTVGNIFDLTEEEILASLHELKGRLRSEVSAVSGVCEVCLLKEKCGGGCRADAFGAAGKESASPHICELLRERNLFPAELIKSTEVAC